VTDAIGKTKPVVGLGSVERTPQGFRFSLAETFIENTLHLEDRGAVYDEAGQPTLVWRSLGTPDVSCLLTPPLIRGMRLWCGAQTTNEQGGGDSGYMTGVFGSIFGNEPPLPMTVASQGWDASEDVFAVNELSGVGWTLFDRLTNTAKSFGTADHQLGTAHPVGSAVFAPRDASFQVWEGWVWTHETQDFVPLIQPPGEVVPDINSDGQTLVWVQTPPKGMWNEPYYPPGYLWTSPMATTKAGLQPQKRRPAPLVAALNSSLANDGYYMIIGSDGFHVYRLADMQHWSFMPEGWNAGRIPVYLDRHTLWYWGHAGIFRQSLDALGPGDPAP
jgi:hypothetical protein